MTRAMRAVREPSGARWLRWALVQDASIVREARIGPDQTLTVGREGDVHAAAIAGRAPLASFREGRWHLALQPSFEARVGERVIEGEAIELALDDDARVRVVIGDGVVLLQVIERPPARKAAPLPPSLRGGLLQRADWWFTAFVIGSFMLHFALVAVVLEADWPIDRSVIPEAYRTVTAIFPEQPPPSDAPIEPMDVDADTSSDDGGGEQRADASNDHAPPSPSRNSRASRDPQPSMSDAEARDAAQHAIAMLGTIMGGQGSATDLLIHGADMPSAAELLEMSSAGVAVNGDPSVLAPREGSTNLCTGDGCLGDLRGLARNGRAGRQVEEGRPVEEVVLVVRPDPSGPITDPPPPGWDPRELTQALRRKMTAVQRCFEREITTGNPDAGGRMVITMQVMPPGHLSGVHAEENETGSDSLAACAARTLATVRLRAGPSEPLEVRYPIVFQRRE